MELVALIRARSVSPVEVVEAHLRRIDEINPSVNAIVTLADDAVDRARDAETKLFSRNEIGPLHGLPLTIKDTIHVRGLRTTSGSRLLANYVPDRDATLVSRLRAGGAIILGKTNVAEMAAYYESDNPIFGRTNNPHDVTCTAGGSSGGEAAAISACLSPAGLGSDLAGSIRLPAHFCGISGLKPTTGRLPVDGHTPEAVSSLSLGVSLGPLARNVEDLALLFMVMADPSSGEVNHNQSKWSDLRNVNLRGLRAAWYANDGVTPVGKETAQAVEDAAGALRDAGLELKQATPPGVTQGLGLWLELFAKTVSKQLREFYRGHEGEAGPQVSAMLARARGEEDPGMAEKVSAAERLAKAVVERERLRQQLLLWMKTMPLIIAPVGATPAFAHGAQRVEVEGESISVFRAFSYSQTYNVFGLPSVAVPVGRSAKGLPIGVQIVGRPFAERTVLDAAEIVEQALGGWQRPPKFCADDK